MSALYNPIYAVFILSVRSQLLTLPEELAAFELRDILESCFHKLSCFLKVSNELVLPFHILHQSVIVAAALHVVGLNLIVTEKYLLVVLVSFPTIAALLYPISKINLLRFLFGMRMKNRST